MQPERHTLKPPHRLRGRGVVDDGPGEEGSGAVGGAERDGDRAAPPGSWRNWDSVNCESCGEGDNSAATASSGNSTRSESSEDLGSPGGPPLPFLHGLRGL